MDLVQDCSGFKVVKGLGFRVWGSRPEHIGSCVLRAEVVGRRSIVIASYDSAYVCVYIPPLCSFLLEISSCSEAFCFSLSDPYLSPEAKVLRKCSSPKI